MPEEQKVLKGRIVYRGDIGRDEYGAAAIYQDISANPTSVQGLNNCIAYGMMEGNTISTADAIKAYVQSFLKAAQPTWIELPRELWPAQWIGKYKKPVVLLKKSLYGHPEAGGHWEKHLESILFELGAVSIPEFTSMYWFPKTKLLLTVYVDDLTLSGPSQAHQDFWKLLGARVDIEPPTKLDRVLGRHHDMTTVPANRCAGTAHDDNRNIRVLSFNMSEYARQCCELYESLPGSKRLKSAATPFCSDGALVASDDEVRGELAPNACKVLMKCLWLGRLARPDIIKPIGDLATQVQNWTLNCDKRLYRLLCYIGSTIDHRLVARLDNAPKDIQLSLYIDADFAGDRESSRSTNGGLLVLTGPESYFPIAWVSKRQTSTSRSTTEAEVVSLAYSLYGEALPTLSLWEKLLGFDVKLKCYEDNQATILVVKKGFSPKLRHIARTHKVNLGGLSEIFSDQVSLEYIVTDKQAADVFTKALPPQKWEAAMKMLNIVDFSQLNKPSSNHSS